MGPLGQMGWGMERDATHGGMRRIARGLTAAILLVGLLPATASAEGFSVELVEDLVPGRPGETVGVMTGSGCPHDDQFDGPSRVAVTIPEAAPFGLLLAALDPAPDGTFGPTDLVVPDDATPGVYVVHVDCRFSDGTDQTTLGQLEVLPPADVPDSPTGTLAPASVVVPPGQPLTFTAPVESTAEGKHEHAFIFGQQITLVLYPGAEVVGSATAPTSPGVVELEIDAPMTVGDHVLVAFGALEVPPGMIHGPSFVADIEVREDASPLPPEQPAPTEPDPTEPDPTEPAPPAAVVFSDVAPGDVHADAILRLAELGILLGYPDGTFGPTEPVSRGQLASMLARALGLEPVAEGPFPDVDPTGVHAGSINALAAAGLLVGRPDGTFDVHGGATRGQLSSVLAAAADLPDGDDGAFSDIAGSVHAGAIAALAEAGIVEGYPDGTFRPSQLVTRGQAATFIMGMLDLLADD
jgi:hypothetical protein